MINDKQASIANQEQILRVLSLDRNAQRLLKLHQFLEDNKINFPYEWFWNPKVVEALKRIEAELHRQIPEAESIELSTILKNQSYVGRDVVESFRKMIRLMSMYLKLLEAEVRTIDRVIKKPRRKELTVKFQKGKAREIESILHAIDEIIKRHVEEYASILRNTKDKRNTASKVKGSITYESIKRWEDAIKYCHPPILPQDILNFKEWLFLSGYKYPISDHAGFDFSAYVDTEGRKILGLPKMTPVRAILPGRVCHLYHEIEDPWSFWSYFCKITIAHSKIKGMVYKNLKGIPFVSDYSHVVPIVKKGDFVDRGQTIGYLFALDGSDRGPLCHLHLSLANFETFDIDRITIDPLRILFPKKTFDKINLPRVNGPFTKEELILYGLHVANYSILWYNLR